MKVKILILALSIVTLAGCGNDESPLGDTTGNSGPTALHVNGNICVTSRANDTRWEPNDRIGIYMLAGETVEQNNKLYTTTDGSGKFTATEAEAIYLPTDGSRRNFVAYYPYTENLGDNGRTYTIDITDQSSQSAIDLLGSDNPETDKNTPSVRFTFYHKLAKINHEIHVRLDDCDSHRHDCRHLRIRLSLRPSGHSAGIPASNGCSAEISICTPNSISPPIRKFRRRLR